MLVKSSAKQTEIRVIFIYKDRICKIRKEERKGKKDLENQKGSVDLKITNTVNNVLSYNATNNKKLTYNISVKNNGNITSSNNVIVTNVPDGITVKEDTISDKGVYNKTKNTISWVLSSLSPSESHTFTYEAIVPESALVTNKYIGNSYIMSDQIVTQVKSEDTVQVETEITEDASTSSKNSNSILGGQMGGQMPGGSGERPSGNFDRGERPSRSNE